MSKQYGLIIPNKNKKLFTGNILIRPSIFNEDSDSDTPSALKPTGQTKSRKQDKINQNKALEEDPTVYQYDEIYDEIEQKRVECKLARKDLDKKPKYINKLLAAADRRKRENERRIERQVQKEREEEGEEFKDKESFVTSAYKKKLEELKALEEQEKREEYLESIGDVRKQGNLDGFYRHLYDQKVNYEDKKDQELKVNEEAKSGSGKDLHEAKLVRSEESVGNQDQNKKLIKESGSKKRKYRSRNDSGRDSEPENEEIDVKKEHLPSNLDADSDFSIDSSESEDEDNGKLAKQGDVCEKLCLPAKGDVLSDNAALAKKYEDDGKKSEERQEENGETKMVEEEVMETKKPKLDIWKKRTVGEVFDNAVKRYFERRALREAASRNT